MSGTSLVDGSSRRDPLRQANRVLDGIVQRTADLRPIALMRVLFGAIVIRHLWPDLWSLVTPVERFHVTWWSWLPVPSPGLYRILLWVGVAAGVAMLLGLAVRLATVTALTVVSYLLFVDMTSFAHNRGFLVWMLFGLSLLPTGGAYTVLNLRRRRTEPEGASRETPAEPVRASAVTRLIARTVTRGFTSWLVHRRPATRLMPRRFPRRIAPGPVWPVLMLQIVVSSVYLASGGTKLLNPDWRGGQVLWDRMLRHEHLIPFDGWAYDVLVSRTFHHLLAPSAIAVELFLGIGLWFGRTRGAAVILAIVFHVSIEITASVQTFSYSALAALLIWAVPTTARDDPQLAVKD